MVVGNDRASSVADRIDGYRLALRDHDIDLPFQSPIHLNTHDKEVEASADKVVEQLVSGSQPATAVFAVNDRVAFYLMEAAKRKGISIPGQFSLIGFDWLARWIPSGGDLTTLAQPFEEIGRAAAQRVLDRILQPKATPRDILFDAELVVKNSTARLPL
jgi:LacI family transcriptional regulator